MMRNAIFIYLILSLEFIGCTEEVDTSEVIEDVILKPTEIEADGTSTVAITARLNEKVDKRTVIFNTNQGKFKENEETKFSTEAKFIAKDSLVAYAELIAPSTFGNEEIEIVTSLDLEDSTYITKQTNIITLLASEPSYINLETNSFYVENNYGSEIAITGFLKNSKGNGVSEGHKVKMEDFDSNFDPLFGDFRNKDTISNSGSQVSAIYSPGFVQANQYMYIIATVYDLSPEETIIKDTLRIYIKENE